MFGRGWIVYVAWGQEFACKIPSLYLVEVCCDSPQSCEACLGEPQQTRDTRLFIVQPGERFLPFSHHLIASNFAGHDKSNQQFEQRTRITRLASKLKTRFCALTESFGIHVMAEQFVALDTRLKCSDYYDESGHESWILYWYARQIPCILRRRYTRVVDSNLVSKATCSPFGSHLPLTSEWFTH